MSTTGTAEPAAPPNPLLTRKLPPVAELLVASIVMMLIGGIFMAAHLPAPPALGVPAGLLVAGGAITVAAAAILSRVRPFAWGCFFQVFRWALLAYLVIAGLLAFVFVHNDLTGATLAVVVATLAVFAVDVPTILAFTVARYQPARG